MCFFFNDTATTEIYTLSLHDALPIFIAMIKNSAVIGATLALATDLLKTAREINNDTLQTVPVFFWAACGYLLLTIPTTDRKSTRLNSSHANISYAVFCLKKKKTIIQS